MATATADTPETADEESKTWTLREVERQRETLEDLRTQLVDLAEREDELDEAIAEAMADGEDAEELKDERREVRELHRDLEAVAPVLESKIERRHYLAHKELARERLDSIKRKIGGLCGEAPRRARKAEELAEKLVAQLEWLANANTRRSLHRKEARALADAYNLDEPELKSFNVDTTGAVAGVKRTVRRVSSPRDSLTLGDGEKAVRMLANLYDEDSPTLELLEAVEAPQAAEE